MPINKPAAAAKPAPAATKPTAAKPTAAAAKPNAATTKAPAKPTAAAAKPAPAATKPAAAKPAKAPAKPAKPFQAGELVIFKGYTKPPAEGEALFTPDQELAVVSERLNEGNEQVIACVPASQYHQFLQDENSVNGEEILTKEVKRTGKMVEQPFELVLVGDMPTILAEGVDPREAAVQLYSTAEQSFFYLGGVLSKLYKEKDTEGASLFTHYKNGAGKSYEDSREGFIAFVNDNLGSQIGGWSKINYHMSIYEAFSALPNAETIIASLPQVGWWKASLLSGYVTEANAQELVKIASEQSYDKLNETLKTKFTTEGSTNARGKSVSRTIIKKVEFGFKLFEDHADGVTMVLAAAKKQTGITDDSQLFEHIVMEWASDHLSEAKNKAEAAASKKRAALIKAGAKLPAEHPDAKAAEPAKAAA